MTNILSMLDRFEQAAATYETSTDKADRDELHAARRAIMEAFEAGGMRGPELPKLLRDWTPPFHLTGDGIKDSKGCWIMSATSHHLAQQLVEVMNFAGPATPPPSPPASAREAELVKALRKAEQFIVNGVEFGFIRMPDPDTPDTAHETLPLIQATLRAAIHPSLEQE